MVRTRNFDRLSIGCLTTPATKALPLIPGGGAFLASNPPRKRCRNCDQPFYPRSNYLEQVFCSRRCARAWQHLPARLRLV